MSKCVQCGWENREGASFCASCGSILAPFDKVPIANDDVSSAASPQSGTTAVPGSDTPSPSLQSPLSDVGTAAGPSLVNSPQTAPEDSGIFGMAYSIFAIALFIVARVVDGGAPDGQYRVVNTDRTTFFAGLNGLIYFLLFRPWHSVAIDIWHDAQFAYRAGVIVGAIFYIGAIRYIAASIARLVVLVKRTKERFERFLDSSDGGKPNR